MILFRVQSPRHNHVNNECHDLMHDDINRTNVHGQCTTINVDNTLAHMRTTPKHKHGPHMHKHI